MAVRYVQDLDVIVRANMQITHVFIENAVREVLGIAEGDEPDGFPSLEQLVKRCCILEKNLRKERGLLGGYGMPKHYADLLQVIVRDNEKMEHDQVPIELCRRMGIEPGTEEEDFPLRKQIKSKVNAIRTQLRKERVAAKYKIPGKYILGLIAVDGKVPNAKPAAIEGLLLNELNVEDGDVLDDFPPVPELKKMFNRIRRKWRKQTADAEVRRGGDGVLDDDGTTVTKGATKRQKR